MKQKILLLSLIAIGFLTQSFAQKYKFGKVSVEELKETVCPLDPTAEAAFLYKSKTLRYEFNTVSGNFEKIEDVYIRIKIYNKEGFSYGNQSILFYDPNTGSEENVTGIKATTYNLIKGKIDKQKVDRKEIYNEKKNKYYSYKKIPFPNLKEGCVLELKYKLTSNYFSVPPYWLQENIPIKKLEYITRVPEYFHFKKSTRGYYTVTPKVETTSASITTATDTFNYSEEKTTFEGENIPSLKDDEPFTANYENYRGVVNMELASYQYPGGYLHNVSSTWDSVCAELFDSYSFGRELDKSSYFKDDLEAILATTGDDLGTKIYGIFQFVKSKVTWNGYSGIYTNSGVSKAYKEGEGNVAEINLILVAMLKKAGISAYPVLLSTKKHGVPFYPTLDGLNYVIAGVKDENGNVMVLDATEYYSDINVLPARDLNWRGRMMLSKGVSVSVPLTTGQKSEEYYMANLSFNENFEVSGSVMAKYTKREALKFRNNYNGLSPEKLKAALEKKWNVGLQKVDVKNKEEIFKPIMASLQVSSSDLCETINDKKYINPLVFFKEENNPFKLETRKYPVDLVSPFKETKIVMIKIPSGYRVVSLPESIRMTMSNNIGGYSFYVKQVGDMISVKAVMDFNKSIVTTREYPELKELYKNIILKNKEKIVLEKITVASAN